MNFRHSVGVIIILMIPVVSPAQQVGFSCGAFSGGLYRVSIPTGQIDLIGGGSLYDIETFAISRNGSLYGLTGSPPELKLIDTATGNAVTIGSVTVLPGQYPTGIAFDSEDRLLLLANANPQSALYEVDPSDAETSFITSIDSNALIRFAVHDSSCFALDYEGRLFALNLVTGSVSGLSGSPYPAVKDVSFDRFGELWGIEAIVDPFLGCDTTFLVRFDLATGEFSRISQVPNTYNGDCLRPIAIATDQPAAVPVDGIIGSVLMGLLLALIGTTIIVARNS